MKRSRLLLAAVSILAALVYANSLANGFALDDHFIIADNADVHGIATLPDAVTGPYWPDGPPELGMYRPAPLATFAAEWSLWDGRPFGFHLGNVLLHAAVTALVFLLLARLRAAPVAAAAGAALFAVHPVHVEAVANVVGRAELLVALFFLLACLAYLRLRTGWAQAGAVAGLYLLGLLSKENAVTLPGALVLLHLARGEGWRAAVAAVRERWRVYLGVAVALALYFVLRWLNIGALLGGKTAAWFWNEPESTRLWTALRVIPEYVRLMLFPADLVADYGPAVIVPERSWASPGVLGGVLTAAIAALAAAATWGRARLVGVGILWFAGTVLPVSGLLFATGFILAERTLYLPSIGLAMVAAGVLGRLDLAVPRVRRGAIAVLGVLVVAGAVRTWVRTPVWRSTDAVLDNLIETHPTNYRAQWVYGTWLQQNGREEAALDHLALALRMAPGYYNIRLQYADLLRERGNHAAAAAHYDTARAVLPLNPVAHMRYLQSLLADGRPELAAAAGDTIALSFPDRPLIHHLHAQALRRSGLLERARQSRLRALGVDRPQNAWAHWIDVAAIDLMRSLPELAAAALDSARAHAPTRDGVPGVEDLRVAIEREDRAVIPFW